MNDPTFSKTHLVLIPSYNSGAIVLRTVEEVLTLWLPVWVVIDGSDDGTAELLEKMALEHSNLRVLRLARNHGKGYAVLQGAREAAADGYSHILAFDADGQHPARFIPRYMALSQEHPNEMILGKPVFQEMRRGNESGAGSSVTSGRTSRRWAEASAIRSSECASIRPIHFSK